MNVDWSVVMPLPDAVRSFDARSVVGTALRSAELEQLPLALRKRAFFSAGVESARFLERAKSEIDKSIKQFGINRDRASFVAEMQALADDMGIRPVDGTRGTLEDIGSARRLRLIYDVQVQMARGEADWRSGQDGDILNAFPAQELLRVEEREEVRDWPQRWRDAGGQFYGLQRMIALKTDPIWIAISRFDQPWPPFDFGSGMGLRDVRWRDAVRLGLIERGQRLDPVAAQFDADIEAGLQGLSEPVAAGLQSFFGPAARGSADGASLSLVPEVAPSLRHVVRIPAGSDEVTLQAVSDGLDMIDAVHGIDDEVQGLNVGGEFDGVFDFVEEVGRVMMPGVEAAEVRAVEAAIAKATPLRAEDGVDWMARAYAQYVGQESGRVSEMKNIFWDNAQFETIRRALGALFKSLNWLR